MTEANDPWARYGTGRRYHDLLLQPVNALTAAARLHWTGAGTEGQAVTGRADWAEFVSLALAGSAAKIGGIAAILAGRTGSWDADYVRNLLASTFGYDEQYLHRNAPSRLSSTCSSPRSSMTRGCGSPPRMRGGSSFGAMWGSTGIPGWYLPTAPKGDGDGGSGS